MSELALVIFDLDGTLVDSRHLIVQMMTVAADQAGLSIPSEEAICRIIGLSLDHAAAALFPDAGSRVQDSVAAAYRTEALRLRADPNDPEALFPGARNAVRDLREAGYILGIATGKARRGVAHFCERYDMVGWFDTVQTPDTNPSKPHPGMIESALAETEASRSRTIMIGDTAFDLEMARNAGVSALGVTWGNHPVSDLECAGAHHLVSKFEDLPKVISELIGQGALL